MHSKQIYDTRNTIHSRSHRLGPWVINIIPSFAGFLIAFLLEIWIYTLTFPYLSQGPLLKVSKGHIKVLGPWCTSCCISSDPTGILLLWSSSFFFIIIIIFSFFFPSFWDFGPSWSFLTSWIRSSFVKTHGLSLLFMEWAIM